MKRQGQTGQQQRLAAVIHTRPYTKGLVLRALMDEAYSVSEQSAGPEALELILELSPDLVVVSLDPDEVSWPIGNALSRTLRQRQVIAIVPDTTRRLDRVLDEFATAFIRDADVPLSFAAQVRAFTRMATPAEEETPEPTYNVGELEVDMARMRASFRGVPLDLGPSATNILGHLVKERGQIISPVALLEQGLNRTYSEAAAKVVVRQYIRRIRRALEAAGSSPNLVVNVRGFGYMVEQTPSGAATAAY
jgi:two-component system, OmpR family, KDP operon response regulator KdpE